MSAVLHPWLWGAIGGALIGLSASFAWSWSGRVTGISGLVAGVMRGERNFPLWFLLGLVLAGGWLLQLTTFGSEQPTRAWPMLIVSGLLVGYGTRVANGCTSGHGVCGVSRGSIRSLTATITFVATAALTVFLVRHVLPGGAP